MNSERLLALFDEVADAPDAVPRLRRFVLDLAVRGKLVEQDPADEPASELLDRIEAEKERLAKAGVIGRPKALVQPGGERYPFPLPKTWAWTQIAALGVISPRNDFPDNHVASFVPMRMIPAEYGASHASETRSWGEIKKGYTHFAEGDVGLAKITPCFENGKSIVFRNLTGGIGSGTTELHVVRPIFVDADYIVLFLKSPFFIENGIQRMTGTAGQKRAPRAYFAHSPFPLPPHAEQRRIVAKVNELMALCDRLEETRTVREVTRDQLAEASYARLSVLDTNDVTFRSHARFAVNVLPVLTARADQVKRIREAVLDLAVRGKLVKQDPDDEPTSYLLKRIALEKAELIESRKIRKKKSFPPPKRAEEPFSVPPKWKWTLLGNLCHVVTDGTHHTPRYIDNGIPFLSVKDVSSGSVNFTNVRYISESQHKELCKRCCPEQGDILLTKVGTTGIAAPIKTKRPFSIFVSVALLKFSVANLSQDYLCYLLNSPFVRQQSKDGTQGIGNQNLVLRSINSFALPIPPLAEQIRIVAKVGELMTLCDSLEANRTISDNTCSRLLEALVNEALESTSKISRAA